MKLLTTRHSMKLMWGCAAIALLAAIVAFTGNAYALLFLVPCALMMGAMMWMMMGGGTRGDGQDGAPGGSRGRVGKGKP